MKASFWKRDWFIGFVVVLFVALAADLGALRRLEWTAYDLGLRYSFARPANGRVVVIAIDDPSLARLGPWPWSRDLFAEITTQLAAARPAVIAYALPFDVAQNERALELLSGLESNNANAFGKSAKALIGRTLARLDTDRTLAVSFRRAGNVVLAVNCQVGDRQSVAEAELPTALQRHTLSKVSGSPSTAFARVLQFQPPVFTDRLRAPLPAIAQSAAAVGLEGELPVANGAANAVPLVLSYGGHYLPSFALSVAAASQGVRTGEIRVELGRGVRIGRTWIATDVRLQAHPYFYKTRTGKSPFAVFSFYDVQQHKVPAQAFRNKVVLIGLTASALVEPRPTPIGEPMAPVLIAANTVTSLLNGDLYRVSVLSTWGRAAGFALVGLYLMFILPGLRVGTGFALSGLLLLVLGYAQFMLMLMESVWVPLMAPAAALLCGHLVMIGKHLTRDKLDRFRTELSESNRMLGLAFQSQGQLDMAFDRFRKCRADASLLELLYTLALDYERKRQFNKARNVYQYLLTHNRRFRDVRERLARNQALENTTVLSLGTSAHATGSLIIEGDGVQKPMLGRYEIQVEIGKGGMGVVYLGRDPKLSRVLAIKALALSQEFEGEKLAEVKERFFREARTAARLNHPGIVTIYDVGDEQDFAYIAMDYMQGEDLSVYCKADNLLPVDEVLNVMLQVAEALDYAHSQRVVHRDIKPANIIYDRESGIAKVTDFGVACLVDSRVTRSGVTLGTPCYMSPEQLADTRSLDGRSDLFSLGITFYELVTGELPFDDDSLSSLMYKIANKKHRDVRKLRPELPACVSAIINKALTKEVKKRFQTGAEMVEALRACGEK